MKKLLFLLLGLTVAVSASAGVQTKAASKKATVNTSVNIGKSVNVQFEKPLINRLNTLTAKPMTFRAPARENIPDGYVAVTLEAHDVWGDGSGYQMLFDADATAVTDTIIVPNLNNFEPGDLPQSFYDEFEYKIPEDADGAVSTQNMVFDGSITIYMPAGTYDWVVLNPSPNETAEYNRFWVPGLNGKYSQFEFVAGLVYHFTIVNDSEYGDNVTLQIEEPGSALTVPENVAVEEGDVFANVSWEDADDMSWNLRWRPYNPNAGETYVWNWDTDESFEGWSVWDSDGDGFNYGVLTNANYANSGEKCMLSESYDFDNYSALDPMNFLISPEVKLDGTLKVMARAYSATYADGFAVYVNTTGNVVDIDSWQLVGQPITCTDSYQEYTFDLSEFEGVTGNFAVVHCNSYDCYYLFVDDITLDIPGEEAAEWIYPENYVDETEFEITGLTPETTYEVQVQAVGNLGGSAWTASEIFTTLPAAPAIPDVYMLGGNMDNWVPNEGVKMNYDEESNLYTLNFTFDGRHDGFNYFGFTKELAENDDQGAWDYIAPFRFGAVSEGDFEVNDGTLNIDISLIAFNEGGQAFKIPAGEYNMTLDLENMTLKIEKVEVPPVGMKGDVNDDQVVNVTDVTILISAIQNDNYDNINFYNSDMNDDENINITDVTMLINYVLSMM